jgi:guanylate kinase
MKRPLFVVTGPSAAGKTAIASEMHARIPELKRIVTCTTRIPRDGELDGRDYHFLTRDQFEAGIAAKEFIEHADVYGNYYGARKSDVINALDSGDAYLVVVDPQGADSYAEHFPDIHFIFVIAPPAETFARLLERNEPTEVAARRLAEAQHDLLAVSRPYFDLIVNNANGRLVESAAQVERLISEAIGRPMTIRYTGFRGCGINKI